MLGPRNVGSLAVGETLESKMGPNSQSISCSSPPTDSCHISFPFPFVYDTDIDDNIRLPLDPHLLFITSSLVYVTSMLADLNLGDWASINEYFV